MFVHKLKLEAWRSHKSTEFSFGKINLIRGPNNSGKSSVAQSIEYVLTGRCLGLDEAGRGAEAMIGSGAKQTTITAAVGTPRASDAELTRTRNGSGGSVTMKVASRVYAGKQVEETFEKWGFGKDVMSAALRGGRFLSLSPAAQKELLADVLKPEAAAVPREIQEAMGLCFAGFIIEHVDLEGARELEERATKLRAECTAALRELGEPEKVEERPLGSPTAAQVEKRLDSLRAEQNSIVREKEKLENAWAERSEKRRGLPKLIAAAKKRILPEADEKKHLEAIEHETETLKALDELRRVNIQIEETEHKIKGTKKTEGKCPTCGHETDTEELIKRFEDSLSALRSRVPGLTATADRYDTQASRAALAEHRAAVTDLAKLEKELAGLGDPKADVVPNSKPAQEKIDELEGRIQKGQSILAQIAGHEERHAAWQSAVQRRASLEARREAADVLAKFCGPSGVQAQMAQGKLAPFTDAINAVLGRFGYACKFELEPYSIRVGRVGGDANLELGSLSESEQWRFSLGFQAALAVATGLKIITLDRADVLVGANRGTMLKTILSCDLDQIFVLASVNEKSILPKEFTCFDLSLNAAGETVVEKG